MRVKGRELLFAVLFGLSSLVSIILYSIEGKSFSEGILVPTVFLLVTYFLAFRYIRWLLFLGGVVLAGLLVFGSAFICFDVCPEGVNVTYAINLLYFSIASFVASLILLCFRRKEIVYPLQITLAIIYIALILIVN